MSKVMMRSGLLFIFVLVLMAGLLLFLWRIQPGVLPSAHLHQPLPRFAAVDLWDEQQVIDSTQWQGAVALINVWATWCAPCRQEHSMLVYIANDLNIPIYGINYLDDKEQAIVWLTDYGNPYQQVMADMMGIAATDLGVYGVPETFIINKQGQIMHRHTGIINDKVWNEKIWPIIESLS